MTYIPGAPIPGLTSARTRLLTGTREVNDWYRTPPRLTRALLDRERFDGAVWDPCCGDGAMAEVLTERGYSVVATDLVDRGYSAGGDDFLFAGALAAPNICMNPPFKLADEFVLHALRLGARKIAVLQRLAWLEGTKRLAALWYPHPPARVWVFSYRGTLWRGDDPNPQDKGGVMAMAWYVWEAAFNGEPALKWIAP